MLVKKLTYTLLFFMVTVFSLQAQKFVNLENRWRMIAYPNWVGTHPYLTFFKDSIEIEGKYYYQRYTSVDPTLQVIDTTGEYYREEAGFVYHRGNHHYPNLSKELVIYNFNLNVGDSINLINYRLKVVKIDSIILLDGSKHKRWEFISNRRFFYYNLYWVEGIGSLNLETLRPELATLTDGANSFSCYFYKDELLYISPYDPGNNAGMSCAARLGSDPVSTRDLRELNSLEVLQNLGDGEVIFQLNESGRYQCLLFTATGALLEQKVLGQGIHRISLSAFPRGMYFLRVLDTERRQQKTLKVVW